MDATTHASIEPDPNEQASSFTQRHPIFAEQIQARQQMVSHQIAGRGVRDPNVLKAMQTVPRHAFVPKRLQSRAYDDGPLPIGYDQTISQPYIVAYMTEALGLVANSIVLEIGTGSGYQTTVCAEIVRDVYTIEIVEKLADTAKGRLAELGYQNVTVKAGDGFYGWPEHTPFDAIIGTAAAGHIPEPLIEQLKEGGRMIIPIGERDGVQVLVLMTKDEQGRIHREELLPVRFVPMTGEVEKSV